MIFLQMVHAKLLLCELTKKQRNNIALILYNISNTRTTSFIKSTLYSTWIFLLLWQSNYFFIVAFSKAFLKLEWSNDDHQYPAFISFSIDIGYNNQRLFKITLFVAVSVDVINDVMMNNKTQMCSRILLMRKMVQYR